VIGVGRVGRWASCPPTMTPGLCVADVDECAMGTHNCQVGFLCQNTKGSFYCQARQRCMEGFLQDPEGNCVGEQPRGLGWGWR
jgi:fibulin 1/2